MTQPYQTSCCCGGGGGPPTGECVPCSTGTYCSSIASGTPCNQTFHAIGSVCMIVTFDSVTAPELLPLAGLTFHLVHTLGPSVSMATYWRIVGVGDLAWVQIGTTIFRIQFAFVAESERAAIGACPVELGCQPYTGANSMVRLRIDATPMDYSTTYWCPAAIDPNHIAGATVTFDQTNTGPVNPCNIGQVNTAFATVTVALASGNDSGLLSGDCSGTPTMGACCQPDGTCFDSTAAQCAQAGGTFQGVGTSCGSTQCQQPLGACCRPNGICIERTQQSCVSAGFTWLGPNTSCTPNPCQGGGPTTGACCVPQAGGFGLCTENVTEQTCLNSQGLWLGLGTTCGFIDCPPPPYGNGRSRGLGDTIARFFRATGIERLVKRLAGKNGCGCAARQAKLNTMFPYAKGNT